MALKFPREKFNQVAKRAARRWGKVLSGRKLGEDDVSKVEVLAKTESDALYMYAAQRNREGSWDLVFFERTFFGGRECEQPVLQNASLEQCLEKLYRHSPPVGRGGKLMLPCDMRRVAAMIDYVPPADIKGEWHAETEAIEHIRETSMEKRREKTKGDIAELRRILGKDAPKP